MYKSPIDIIYENMTSQIIEEQEKKIIQCVQKYNINVDKEELIKALKYDREQYQRGYQDGYKAGEKGCEWVSGLILEIKRFENKMDKDKSIKSAYDITDKIINIIMNYSEEGADDD